MAIWVSRIPRQFLLNVRITIHTCTQMGIDAYFKEADVTLKSVNLDVDISKMDYSTKKKKAKNIRRNPL